MLDQPISVGDLVEYHGSIGWCHGEYRVVALEPALHPDDDSTRYRLDAPEGLCNVRRESITLISTGG